jgi:hypothetical protein
MRNAQTASADSAAIVALELEMSRLLAAGRVDEYATHLTSDYARTTRQGILERRDAAPASWRARGPGGLMRPAELWVRVYGDAAVLTGSLQERIRLHPVRAPPRHSCVSSDSGCWRRFNGSGIAQR